MSVDLSLAGLLAYTFFGVSVWQFLCWWEDKKDNLSPEYREKLMRWRMWGCVIVTVAATIWAVFN